MSNGLLCPHKNFRSPIYVFVDLPDSIPFLVDRSSELALECDFLEVLTLRLVSME
jgi:hypothetical protein